MFEVVRKVHRNKASDHINMESNHVKVCFPRFQCALVYDILCDSDNRLVMVLTAGNFAVIMADIISWFQQVSGALCKIFLFCVLLQNHSICSILVYSFSDS